MTAGELANGQRFYLCRTKQKGTAGVRRAARSINVLVDGKLYRLNNQTAVKPIVRVVG